MKDCMADALPGEYTLAHRPSAVGLYEVPLRLGGRTSISEVLIPGMLSFAGNMQE
jgi:hypothetical protein